MIAFADDAVLEIMSKHLEDIIPIFIESYNGEWAHRTESMLFASRKQLETNTFKLGGIT